ncbi:hypothetical protein K523DRAFT_348270 [Schizophyllum commune Tattone D]|nr:hypothetical protein K523DRAFT_348270 [Schizophyllum commune Tattone D]
MPRQTRSRPSAPSVKPSPVAQTRSSSTMAAPAPMAAPSNSAFRPKSAAAPPPPPVHAASPTHHAAPPAQSQAPGIMSQIAATAGGVALGHGISNMLFGGSSSAPAEQQQAPAPAAPAQQQFGSGVNCEVQAKDFTTCLEKADLPSCTYYLEQLKACQAAAAPY